jgi:putative ABC transport system permease protein
MEALIQNIGFGIRTLLKNKGFTITAVLTLALGIGATTAIFSVVYAVFEPMPYPKPDQLVMVWAKGRGGRNSVASGDFLEWQRRSTSFQSIHTWTGVSFNVSTDERPEQVPGSRRHQVSSPWKDCRCSSAATSCPRKASPATIAPSY